MFADPVEIAELRQSTLDFIAENKWSISFKRRPWTKTPGGGVVQGDEVVLDPQDVYFGAVTVDARQIISEEGNIVSASYVIVGRWTDDPNALDIKEKDYFTVEDRTFEVVEIHPDHEYETRAWVIDRMSDGTISGDR